MNGSPGPDPPPLQSLLFPRTLRGLWSGPVPRIPTGLTPSPQWLRSSVHWHDGQRQTGSRAARCHAHTATPFLCASSGRRPRATERQSTHLNCHSDHAAPQAQASARFKDMKCGRRRMEPIGGAQVCGRRATPPNRLPRRGRDSGTMKCGSLRCRGPPRSPSNDPGSERDKRAFSIKMSWFRQPEGCRFLLQTR